MLSLSLPATKSVICRLLAAACKPEPDYYHFYSGIYDYAFGPES